MRTGGGAGTPRSYGRAVFVVDVLLPLRCVGCGVARGPVCGACRARLPLPSRLPVPPGLDALHVAYAYDGLAREVVARAKYRDAHASLRWCADELRAALGPSAPSLVTWAPTSRSHRRERGFDPAEVIARRVGRARALLERVGEHAQTGHTRAERITGPSFTARATAPNVLLVDDVCTTGATLTAAARALRDAGARTVEGAVFARTP